LRRELKAELMAGSFMEFTPDSGEFRDWQDAENAS
jgi:hypothetical protein